MCQCKILQTCKPSFCVKLCWHLCRYYIVLLCFICFGCFGSSLDSLDSCYAGWPQSHRSFSASHGHHIYLNSSKFYPYLTTASHSAYLSIPGRPPTRCCRSHAFLQSPPIRHEESHTALHRTPHFRTLDFNDFSKMFKVCQSRLMQIARGVLSVSLYFLEVLEIVQCILMQ